MKQVIILVLCAIAIMGCETTTMLGENHRENRKYGSVENPSHSESLVDHLRKIPGINVRGDGRNAQVTIRGISSFYASNEPLFVVSGQALSGGLTEAMELIPVSNIKAIRVLKNPADVGIYGVRGSNGVITIVLK